jgi:hypothetical protein
MSDRPIRQLALELLFASSVVAATSHLGCSSSGRHADASFVRPPVTDHVGAVPVTSNAAIKAERVMLPTLAAPSGVSVESPAPVGSERRTTDPSVAPQLASNRQGSDPITIERSYLLPLGDTGTNRKAIATRYANLTPAACRAELHRRRIAAIPATGLALGIATPMRLLGPLRDVRFVVPGPKSVNGMLDCRLVLLLDELSGLLTEQGVAVVYVDGFYRPKSHLPGKKVPSQHSFGLAVDIHALGTIDGRTLLIERDFAGRVGAPVCGDAAVVEPESTDAVELRNIVCAVARAKAFHYLLTPNYDAAHRNHLHGDIKRGGREHVLR